MGFEKAVVMGHSLGANVSMLFSGTFPQHVARLILLDSVGPVVQKKPEQVKTIHIDIYLFMLQFHLIYSYGLLLCFSTGHNSACNSHYTH